MTGHDRPEYPAYLPIGRKAGDRDTLAAMTPTDNQTAAPTRPRAFFLPVDTEPGGQRLCLLHAAQGAAHGSVLYVHPFAEEMNKSRRKAGLQARVLARVGYDALQIDLRGCGGSSGDAR